MGVAKMCSASFSLLKRLFQNILLHNNKNLQDPLINDLTLKIADFGLSRFISNNTLATTYVGTPIYMAPEIYTKGAYDHQADVWSAGLIVSGIPTTSGGYQKTFI